MIVSAPGKLILAGEYAVLHGGLAVVAAVNRRAFASTTIERAGSPFLISAQVALDIAGLEDASMAMKAIGVDTRAFRNADGAKLGLGSSAAATVAAIGAALHAAGRRFDRDQIHAIARAAHFSAQDGIGSGADIAASTYGGLLAFRRAPADSARTDEYPLVDEPARDARPLPRWTVPWVAMWSGQPADTVALVKAVDRAGERARAAIDAAGVAASWLADATVGRDVISAIGMGADAVERIGAAAGVELVPEPVKRAREVARALGGELKTCGAGGGDTVIAVFPEGCEMDAPLETFRGMGLVPLDLAFDERGVDIEERGAYLP